MIDPKIIEEIKVRNPIEEVMSSYVTLKRAGSNLVCNCPFHSEKTPSCTIFTGTQNFYCFGCGAGGDVINFVRRIENLEYVDALEFLAKKAGITIPQDTGFQYRNERRIDRKRYFEMNKDAARFFRDCLFDEKIGEPGMSYLRRRGLSDAIIKRFGLGYSPNDFGKLTEHMHSLGYTDEELVEAFLCGKKSGRAFDYFRGRVMFPIFDVAGNVIGFGGRVLDNSQPKYLNSSDTPLFKKRNNLYALNYAKNASKEQMILCEGYMDVISLHDKGFGEAVATLGTAITPEQARIMARYTKKVIIAYDADGAGRTAADKACGLLGAVDVQVRLLKMSGAKDPDEYINKFGHDAFANLLNESRGQFEYRLEVTLAKYDISDTAQKITALAELTQYISGIHSSAERDIYISRTAEALGVTRENLLSDVKRALDKRIKKQREEKNKNLTKASSGYGDKVNSDYIKNVKASRAEEQLLAMLLIFEEFRIKVASGAIELKEEDFFTSFGKKLFSAIIKLQLEGIYNESALGEDMTEDEISRVMKIKITRKSLSQNDESVFGAYINALREETRQNTNGADDALADIENILSKKRNT